MDGLNDQQRALAWLSTRDPSFDGVAIIRPDGTIQSANQQFYEILKSTPAEIEGMNWADLFLYPARVLLQKNVQRVLSGKEPRHRDKAMIVTPSGNHVVVALIFTATFRADGSLDFGIKKIIEVQEEKEQPLSSSESQKTGFLRRMTDWKEIIGMSIALIAGVIYAVAEFWRGAR